MAIRSRHARSSPRWARRSVSSSSSVAGAGVASACMRTRYHPRRAQRFPMFANPRELLRERVANGDPQTAGRELELADLLRDAAGRAGGLVGAMARLHDVTV